VWPLDRRKDVLRVGRRRVELWQPSTAGFVLKDQQGMGHEDASPSRLSQAVKDLLVRAGAEGKQRQRQGLDAVLESALLPVMLLDVPATLWSVPQVEALFQHRVNEVYGRPENGSWQLHLVFLPGASRALGYALSPTIRAALLAAVEHAGRKLTALQPALAWGQREVKREMPRNGGYLWIEQDRALVCLAKSGQLVGLNAGASLPHDMQQAHRRLQVECARQGVVDLARGVIAGWEPSAMDLAPHELMRWVCVASNRHAADSTPPPARTRIEVPA